MRTFSAELSYTKRMETFVPAGSDTGSAGYGMVLPGWLRASATFAHGFRAPTFFDLYGFFPGSFVGNSSLKPESSRGYEASGRYRRGPFSVALTYYRQRLHDAAIFLQNPDIGNFDPLIGRVISHLQLAPLLHAGFALHPNAGN